MGRAVIIKNSGSKPLTIYASPNINTSIKLGTLLPNRKIEWNIPAEHSQWGFRDGESFNATRACFTFNSKVKLDSQEIVYRDLYFISSVPPHSSNQANSYGQCVRLTGRTGFNIPVKITCVADGNAIQCLKPGQQQSIKFPKDNNHLYPNYQGGNYVVEFGKPTTTSYKFLK